MEAAILTDIPFDTILILRKNIQTELINVILIFIHAIAGKSVQDVNLIWKLPDLYRHLVFPERSRDFYYAADLMLTAFAEKQYGFAIEIIDYALDIEISTSNLFKKQVMEPDTFFDPAIENDDLTPFRRALLNSALETNRIHILRHMCRATTNAHLEEILCYFSKEFNIELSAAQLGTLTFNGDMTTITYIYEHCEKYKDLLTGPNTFQIILIGAMHGGNLELIHWLHDRTYVRIPSAMRCGTTIKCLLRFNRFDKVQLLAMSDPQYKLALQELTINWIFDMVHDHYFLHLPKITLETYEYCLKNFPETGGATAREIFSDEIMAKYGFCK
jgi:hypothetical protein